ncbi:MAG: hypothetical protein H6Q54_344, partial [Deltaproteobacteria bacterium]|nr:hypothetical protein [Deltaproteobacteria bacterium]
KLVIPIFDNILINCEMLEIFTGIRRWTYNCGASIKSFN